jgi:peroxiredoxin family protein
MGKVINVIYEIPTGEFKSFNSNFSFWENLFFFKTNWLSPKLFYGKKGCDNVAEKCKTMDETSTRRDKRKVTILLFHDELCQVFNALMTALSLLRSNADVTVFFGSRGINVVHRERINELKCLPDQPEDVQKEIMNKMDELLLPSVDEMLYMLHAEGAKLLACPLNKDIFDFKKEDFVEGVEIANPATFYTEDVMNSDFVLSF